MDTNEAIFEAKKQYLIDQVEEIAELMGLEYIPEVIFYEGFIPFKSHYVIACINTDNHIIYVSEFYLRTMSLVDIDETVIHELGHYIEKYHNFRFKRGCIDIKINIFKQQTFVPFYDSSKNIKKETTIKKKEVVKIIVNEKQLLNNDPNKDWINDKEK